MKALIQATDPIAGQGPPLAATLQVALVRELSSRDRISLLTHFLSLNHDDRRLRFGQVAPNAVIEHYVHGIDFSRDTVFGVFDDALALAGVAHLAYLPSDGELRTVEFGVSVLEWTRNRGIGTRLFERVAMRARNTHVTTLHMHCLSHNSTMMHIAKKAGMTIEYAYGEAEAYLTLPPADQSSLMTEMLQEQAAVLDYAMKRQARRASQWLNVLRAAPASLWPLDLASANWAA
jgi:RimJ/RimL family protein N-acetyltransferase